MADAATVQAMEALHSCRCCLRRPPDKGLKTLYENVGKTENYWDMLKECFNIHLNVGNDECGICEVCVARLRDATEFKMQVQQSQMDLKALLEKALQEKDKKPSLIKVEIVEEDPNVEEVMIQDDDGPVKAELGDGDIVSSELSSWTVDVLLATSESEDYQCRVCPMKCDDRYHLQRHEREHEKTPYSCNYCWQSFELETDLIKHVELHNATEIPSDLQCGVCRKILANVNSFKVHMRCHSGDRPYPCEVCNMKFSQKHHVKRHMKSHMKQKFELQSGLTGHMEIHNLPTGSAGHQCGVCGNVLANANSLKVHMRCHSGVKPYACEVCNMKFALKHHVKRHMKSHNKLAHTDDSCESTCNICCQSFKLKSELTEHMEEIHKGLELVEPDVIIHSGEETYTPEVCSLQFAQNSEVKHLSMECHKGQQSSSSDLKHELVHKEKITYTCGTCKKGFDSNTELQKHMLVHKVVKVPTCQICNKRFRNKRLLDSHLITHIKKPTLERDPQEKYTCETCKGEFTSKKLLRAHRNTHTKPFSCEVCQKRFIQKNHLACHVRQHTGEKPYSCDICTKKYAVKCHLQRHKLIHTAGTYFSCYICKTPFKDRTSLLLHKLKQHSDQKPYSCDICKRQFTMLRHLNNHLPTHSRDKLNSFCCEMCGKTYSNGSAFNNHIKRHARDKDGKPYERIHKRVLTGEKSYACEICQRRFRAKSTLKGHMITHTGQKPYSCEVCNKEFSFKCALKVHVRAVHLGEKPYNCNICQKAFKMQSTLRVHVLSHTGEKPFACDDCGKAFITRYLLKKHILRHHNYNVRPM